MEFPIKLDTVKSESSILYIEGPQALILIKYIAFFSPKIDLVVANSTDPDKMPHNISQNDFAKKLKRKIATLFIIFLLFLYVSLYVSIF